MAPQHVGACVVAAAARRASRRRRRRHHRARDRVDDAGVAAASGWRRARTSARSGAAGRPTAKWTPRSSHRRAPSSTHARRAFAEAGDIVLAIEDGASRGSTSGRAGRIGGGSDTRTAERWSADAVQVTRAWLSRTSRPRTWPSSGQSARGLGTNRILVQNTRLCFRRSAQRFFIMSEIRLRASGDISRRRRRLAAACSLVHQPRPSLRLGPTPCCAMPLAQPGRLCGQASRVDRASERSRARARQAPSQSSRPTSSARRHRSVFLGRPRGMHILLDSCEKSAPR